MLPEFESSMLKWLITPDKKGAKYIPLLSNRIFATYEIQIAFSCLQKFYKQYSYQPAKDEFLQYTQNLLIKEKYDNDDINEVLNFLHILYIPFENNASLVKDTVIEHAQFALFKEIMKSYAPRVNEGVTIFKTIFKELNSLIKLSDEEIDYNIQRGNLLFEEGKTNIEFSGVMSLPFKGINKLLGARGVYSPQFIFILGGAKKFKTGILLALALGFAKDGKKVYYADGENGLFSIENRLTQAVCDCNLREVITNRFKEDPEYHYDYIYDNTVARCFSGITDDIRRLSRGEIKVDSYASGSATMLDIDRELEELQRTKGFKPDVIIFDGYEHFNPITKKTSDVLDSQEVIKNIFWLNRKWGVVSFSPAQVKREAADKDKFKAADVGRDWGIIRYASAAWSINSTPEEDKANLLRLETVEQREGESHALGSFLHVDKKNMQVKEVSEEAAIQLLNAVNTDVTLKNKKNLRDI